MKNAIVALAFLLLSSPALAFDAVAFEKKAAIVFMEGWLDGNTKSDDEIRKDKCVENWTELVDLFPRIKGAYAHGDSAGAVILARRARHYAVSADDSLCPDNPDLDEIYGKLGGFINAVEQED